MTVTPTNTFLESSQGGHKGDSHVLLFQQLVWSDMLTMEVLYSYHGYSHGSIPMNLLNFLLQPFTSTTCGTNDHVRKEISFKGLWDYMPFRYIYKKTHRRQGLYMTQAENFLQQLQSLI